MDGKQGSDSDFGSSNTSGSSKISSIDEQLKQLGERKIGSMVVQEYIIAIIINLLPALSYFIEFSLFVRYIGIEPIEQFLFGYLIVELGNCLLKAIGLAGAQMAQKNLTKSQIIIANTYFAHACVLQFVLFIVYCIIGLTISIDRKHIQDYLMIRLTGGLFCQIFGRALNEFYKIDNRTFIMLLQELAAVPINLTVQCVLYNQMKNPTLAIPAYGYLVGNIVLFVWNIFSINHIPFLDAEYRGVLRFSFNRLSPLRPRFFIQIAVRSLNNVSIDLNDVLIFILCVTLVKSIKQYPLHMFHLVTLFMTISIRLILKAVNQANYDTLLLLAGFNVQIKKITRVYECLKNSLIVSFCTIPVIVLVVALITPYIRAFIMPLPQAYWLSYEFRSYVNKLRTPEILAACGQLFPLFYQPAFAFMQLEDKQWFVGMFNLITLVFCVVSLFVLHLTYQSNTPFYLFIFAAEALNGMISIGVLVFFIGKYKALYKLNLQASQNELKIQNVSARGKAETRTEEIRHSVVQQMNMDHDDSVNKQQQQKNKINNVFNKSIALRQSNMFINMRDSVAGSARGSVHNSVRDGSQVLRDSTRGSQYSQVRGGNQGSSVANATPDQQ